MAGLAGLPQRHVRGAVDVVCGASPTHLGRRCSPRRPLCRGLPLRLVRVAVRLPAIDPSRGAGSEQARSRGGARGARGGAGGVGWASVLMLSDAMRGVAWCDVMHLCASDSGD